MALPTIDQAVEAVQTAGLHIRNNFRQNIISTDKADGTPVTAIDRKINAELMFWANTHSLPFIGEEGDNFYDAEYVVVVDPLDGTGAFTRGIAAVTIVLTIMQRIQSTDVWSPVMAVIHDPIGQWTWWAQTDNWAFVQGPDKKHYRARISSTVRERPQITISTWPGVRFNLEKVAAASNQAGFSNQEFGGIALGGGLVASDLMDATVFAGNSAIETVAMSLIVKEAGGAVADIEGKHSLGVFSLTEKDGEYDFSLPSGAIIARNRGVIDELVNLIEEHN